MRILILTESGSGIGFGHITRMRVLAEFLLARGVQVELVCNDHGESDQGRKAVWRPESLDSKSLNPKVGVVVDSYLADSEVYQKLKARARFLAAIDDYNRIVYPADLLINPNVYFEQMDYSNQTGNLFGGKDFVLLRESFRKRESWPGLEQRPGSILITLGGSDYRKLLPTLSGLSKDFGDLTIVSPDDDLRINLSQEYPFVRVLGRLNEIEMRNQFLEAEVIVSACGQTLHELAYLGKKAIGICIDHDQDLNQQFYLRSGLLRTELHWDMSGLLDLIKAELHCLFRESHRPASVNLDPERALGNYLSVLSTFYES